MSARSRCSASRRLAKACVGASNGWRAGTVRDSRRRSTRGAAGVRVKAMVSFGGKLWVGTGGAGCTRRMRPGRSCRRRAGAVDRATCRALWADADGLVVGDGATVALTAGDGAWRRLGDVGLAGASRSTACCAIARARCGSGRDPICGCCRAARRASTDLRDGLPTGYRRGRGPTGMVIGPRGDVLVGTDAGSHIARTVAGACSDRAVGDAGGDGPDAVRRSRGHALDRHRRGCSSCAAAA